MQIKRPLAPCHEAVARKLLKQGKAAIYKRYPFTIILKEIVD
ncbi:RRXRR domain-containing protein, partial [Anoxybacillus flavithermus]